MTVVVEAGKIEARGTVTVMSEPGLTLPPGMVNVTRGPAGLVPPGTAAVGLDVNVAVEGGVQPGGGGPGRVTVRVGTVTVLIDLEGSGRP